MAQAKIMREDLQGLDANGRPCEACGGHMHAHAWAILDEDGFVVECSMTDQAILDELPLDERIRNGL